MRLAKWLCVMLALTAPAGAAEAPAEIKIGTLYAGSGALASASMPLHVALEYWADGVNRAGGVYVKGFGKRVPVRLVAYDDQSSPSLAANLTNQLITQDKVDILTSDSTSIMTASAVPVARDHKMLLWDVTGSSPNFFSKDNPYIVLLALTANDRYAKSLADFVAEMPKLGIKTIALLYLTADYTAFQATAIRKAAEATPGLKIVFDRGIPANTADYTVLVNNVQAAKADALLEFGYPANELAFLRALQDNDVKFKFMSTVYALSEQALMRTNGVVDQLLYTYGLAGPAAFDFHVNHGLDREHYQDAFEHWAAAHNPGVEYGYNAIAGYQAGLVIESALAEAASLDQLELRRAVFALSGKLETLVGDFRLEEDGSQSGLVAPLGQVIPGASGKPFGMTVVWPPGLATGKPVYPAP